MSLKNKLMHSLCSGSTFLPCKGSICYHKMFHDLIHASWIHEYVTTKNISAKSCERGVQMKTCTKQGNSHSIPCFITLKHNWTSEDIRMHTNIFIYIYICTHTQGHIVSPWHLGHPTHTCIHTYTLCAKQLGYKPAVTWHTTKNSVIPPSRRQPHVWGTCHRAHQTSWILFCGASNDRRSSWRHLGFSKICWETQRKAARQRLCGIQWV